MAGHGSPVRRIAIVVIVLAIVGAAGWWAWNEWGSDLVSISDEGTMSGTVEAEESQVSSVIAGRIASSTATEGATVAAGQELFKLDDQVLALQVEQAEAGVRAAQAALDQAKADKATTAQISAAEARLDQAEAAVEIAKAQLSYATITAATDGVITAVVAKVGENASPGKALATISDLSSLHVSVYVPGTEIGQIELGQGATVTTDSSNEVFIGTVDFIADEAEFTPSNIETKEQRVKLVYKVRVKIEDAEGVLKPGMPVDVRFE